MCKCLYMCVLHLWVHWRRKEVRFFFAGETAGGGRESREIVINATSCVCVRIARWCSVFLPFQGNAVKL